MDTAKHLVSILQCPISGTPVKCSDGPEPRFWSESERHGRIDFPVIHGQPVLIDFASSIADRDAFLENEGASLVDGRPAGRSFIKRLILGTNPVEARNAGRLLDLVRQPSSSDRPVILVIGGGTMSEGVKRLYEKQEAKIVCFDIYASSQTDFVADAHSIPIRDETIDAVWIQAVLEHVLTPSRVTDEIVRVLKPGGAIYAETPFLQPVHEGAYDFTRFTESGHRWLFREFEAIDSGVVSGPGTTLFQCLRNFLGAVLRNRRLGSLAATPFFWLRFFDRIIPAGHASDMASGVYFLGKKSANPVGAADMPAFYKGAG